MKKSKRACSCSIRRGNTEQFAKVNHVKGASVRTRLCLTGSYFGTVPDKLENGLLDWPMPCSSNDECDNLDGDQND